MLRLFVGLEVPELHRQRLALVRSPLPGARWIDPADMHITLRFAGDIENGIAREFAGFLADIDVPAFEITIGGLDVFGGREPRIVFAAANGGEALEQLHRATERAARSAGLPPESQTFRPHVTLARLRGTRPEQVARFLGQRPPLSLPPFLVERFVLFSSRPRVGGGPYVVEDAYDLALR